MPTFRTIPIGEARASTVTGKRAALLQEYVGYIQRVAPGQAGRLELGDGETTQGIRHRLTAAAETLGKDLEVRRTGRRSLPLAVGGPRPRKNPFE